MIRIGVAGWSISAKAKSQFPETGHQLSRYSQALSCVEINSSFYQEHQEKTYARWASLTPDDFRFSVKLFRQFTHQQSLEIDPKELKLSLEGIQALKEKLGAILIQLPGSLTLDLKIAKNFFSQFRKIYSGVAVLEPRHASWGTPRALELLNDWAISRVRADPERSALTASAKLQLENEVAGKSAYFRLHGFPEVYRSDYNRSTLNEIKLQIQQLAKTIPEVWCIFDNTALGYAVHNALALKESL